MSTDYPGGPKWTQAHMAHLFNLILNDNPKPLLRDEHYDREHALNVEAARNRTPEQKERERVDGKRLDDLNF